MLKIIFSVIMFLVMVISFIGMIGSNEKAEKRNCVITFIVSVIATMLIILR